MRARPSLLFYCQHSLGMGHLMRSVALTRSLAHIANHIGQIILLARMTVAGPWQSLSIPRGQSQAFNASMTGAKPGA